MDDNDAQSSLKKRARRRLVGAVAFALLVAVVLPMVMDHQPRQVVDEVEIRIPGQDEKPFAPKFAVTPVEKVAPKATEPPADSKSPAPAESPPVVEPVVPTAKVVETPKERQVEKPRQIEVEDVKHLTAVGIEEPLDAPAAFISTRSPVKSVSYRRRSTSPTPPAWA